jgi:SPP1 family predicted phage head-tail adaptor
VIGAGDLNRRLTLEAPNESDDGAGGVTRSYAAVAALWANVAPQAMRADNVAASLGAVQRCRIVIRRRDDVTTRHRLRDGDAIYAIVAARTSTDRRFTEIDAALRED